MPAEQSMPMLLYVEDEFLIQELLVVDLEEAGYEVLVANNGDEAIELLEIQKDALRGLITDVDLGAGPTGWAVGKAARQTTAGLPVVYVSAAGEHEWTSEGVPGSLMIAKPFASTQVVVAISTLLVSSSPTG